MVQPIPDGYPQLSPSICVDGAADAIKFYCDVLGATERCRMQSPDGKVGHAELAFGKSVVMLADPFPEMGFNSPKAIGGTPVVLHLYVDDVDKVFGAAVAAGASPLSEPKDQFYGDRSGSFEDPWGQRWGIATHIEDVPPDEMAKRAKELGY